MYSLLSDTELPELYSSSDPIVRKVLKKYVERSTVGMAKYNVSMQDNKGDLLYWLKNLQEELMDASLYVERLMMEVENAKAK